MNCVTGFRLRGLLLFILMSVFFLPVFAGSRSADEQALYAGVNKIDFSWSRERKLTWEDFKGDFRKDNFENNVAAVTYCSIGYETKVLPGSNKPEIEVFNFFHPDRSWAKHEQESPSILAHEQCHFDICELFTRKLRNRLAAGNITIYNMQEKLNEIYGQVRKEYIAFQDHYEYATNHGLIKDEQLRWEKIVADALSETKAINEGPSL